MTKRGWRELLDGAAWIVDGLLGTGARGEPRPPLDAVIDQLNAAAAPKLAIDLPSGLDCDTGRPARHTIRAAETCTFVTAKTGFFAPEAAPYVGRLHVLDIGTPRKIIEQVAARTRTRPLTLDERDNITNAPRLRSRMSFTHGFHNSSSRFLHVASPAAQRQGARLGEPAERRGQRDDLSAAAAVPHQGPAAEARHGWASSKARPIRSAAS